MNNEELINKLNKYKEWFYDFDLGSELSYSSKLSDDVKAVHQTRLQMVMEGVSDYFGEKLSQVSCLDIGCHEGYFSFEMAKKVNNVIGVDIRSDSLEKAELIRRFKKINNVVFQHGDCYRLEKFAESKFDLTLFLGVLYHLENPIGALKNLASITKKLCIIETQIIDDIDSQIEWGSKKWLRKCEGLFAVIDEQSEFDADNAESGSFAISLCPSIGAIYSILKAVGFKKIVIVKPPIGAYEQHARGRRVVISAAKE